LAGEGGRGTGHRPLLGKEVIVGWRPTSTPSSAQRASQLASAPACTSCARREGAAVAAAGLGAGGHQVRNRVGRHGRWRLDRLRHVGVRTPATRPACAALEELCETTGATPDPATSSTIAALQRRGCGGEGVGRAGEERTVGTVCDEERRENAPEFPRMRVERSPTAKCR
jgi:hypothetical protein